MLIDRRCRALLAAAVAFSPMGALGQTYTPKQREDLHIRDHYTPPSNSYDHPQVIAPAGESPRDTASTGDPASPDRLTGWPRVHYWAWQSVMSTCSPFVSDLAGPLKRELESYLHNGYPPHFDQLKYCFHTIWGSRGQADPAVDAYLDDAEARYLEPHAPGHLRPPTPPPPPPPEPPRFHPSPVTTDVPVVKHKAQKPVLVKGPKKTVDPGMVFVAGYSFEMGSEKGSNQSPVHRVTVAPFTIDKTEVTVAAYRACVTAGKCTAPQSPPIRPYVSTIVAEFCNWNAPGRDDHPINCVDWTQANDYCVAMGRRLPTEAEWELAARGPNGRTYPWGQSPPGPTLLNGCGEECSTWFLREKNWGWAKMYAGGDGYLTTAPVGSFPAGASPCGALDMAGNVGEWIADWYGTYPAERVVQPTGPTQGTSHVVRGGTWSSLYDWEVAGAMRQEGDTDLVPLYRMGFRCAR